MSLCFVLCKLAAREVKVAMAAAAAADTSDSPLPQPSPSQQELAAKAPALAPPQPQSSSAISMTAALKNIGAVSVYLHLIPIYSTYIYSVTVCLATHYHMVLFEYTIFLSYNQFSILYLAADSSKRKLA